MPQTIDLHRTNERVSETGKYVCEKGETRQLQEGDQFPLCPISGTETTWRHTDHQHQTGESVTEAGAYKDADGQQVTLAVGQTFPNCPKSGKATSWKHV